MPGNSDNVIVIPSAKRLILSLRELGYDFSTAIAELVDNSIAAKATKVYIDAKFLGKDSRVIVADNGTGMSPEVLREAMRFGTERDYDDEDLGKFGLGLKTASLSQCQTFTVATRASKKRSVITAYAWDVDHVIQTNRWEILRKRTDDLNPDVVRYLKESKGTAVIWEKLDRILGYKLPDGAFAKKGFFAMVRQLEDHLAMVFHRFLSGEAKRRKLKIFLNENQISPWDPYVRNEPKTKVRDHLIFDLEEDGYKGEIIVRPYILPHHDDFSSPTGFKLAGGPRNWNPQQGFYVYRGNRMIQSGGWCGLRTIDEHLKLSRISLDFPQSMDEAFKTNVSKMRVQIPLSIRDELQKKTFPAVKAARKAYDRGKNTSGGVAIKKKKWSLAEIEAKLKKIANRKETVVINSLFTRLLKELKG